MLGGFTKLSSGLIFSTVWREDMHVRIVWITMLALTDSSGYVAASIPGLADAAHVSIDQCEDALGRLAEPDPYSRTKEHEGRRIVETDGGWILLNYTKYREAGKHNATLTTRGYVYYARDANMVKIGFSKNPWARMADLRIAAPKIELLAVQPGTLDDEKTTHRRFEAIRGDGEWFKATKELMAHVATVATAAATKRQRQ